MLSRARDLLLLSAMLALGVVAAEKKGNLRKLRRDRIHHHAGNDSKQRPGLEEDVVFWRDMARRTQDMSVPGGGEGPGELTDPPVPVPTPVTPAPTDGGVITTLSPTGSNLPEPTDPPEVETPGPTSIGIATPAPTPATGGSFECPQASFVGCTAVDPANPEDECTNVGEPCPGSTAGEFCCVDECPRNYCTAKPALLAQLEFEAKLQAELMMSMGQEETETISKSSTPDPEFWAPIQEDEDWSHLLKNP